MRVGAGESAGLELRAATMADVPAAVALIGRVVPTMQAEGNFQWDESYPNAEVFARDVALGQLWVAEAAGEMAGVAALTAEAEPEYAEVGWDLTEESVVVHRLAVDPRFRGRGAAAALMMQAETVAGERGAAVVRVDTSTRNAATQRLFPRLGYVLAGEIGLAVCPGQRFLCYEKRLGDRGDADGGASAAG